MDQRDEDALQLFLENVNKYINGLCKKSMQIIKRKELKKRGYYIYNNDGQIKYTPPISRIELSININNLPSGDVKDELSLMDIRSLIRRHMNGIIDMLLNIFILYSIDISTITDEEIFFDKFYFTLMLQSLDENEEEDVTVSTSSKLLPFYIYSINRTKYCINSMLSYLAQNNFLIKNESIDDKSIINNFTKDIIKFSKELELNLNKNLNDETEEEVYGNTVFNNNCNDNNNIILNLQQLELKKVLRNKFQNKCVAKEDEHEGNHNENKEESLFYVSSSSSSSSSSEKSLLLVKKNDEDNDEDVMVQTKFGPDLLNNVSANKVYIENIDLFQQLNATFVKNFATKS